MGHQMLGPDPPKHIVSNGRDIVRGRGCVDWTRLSWGRQGDAGQGGGQLDVGADSYAGDS